MKWIVATAIVVGFVGWAITGEIWGAALGVGGSLVLLIGLELCNV